MFDKEYFFRGIHAEKVLKLTTDFDGQGNKLFQRNFDVYLLAPIVGFLYSVKADLDKGERETKIFADILMREKDDLWFNYRLIMLLDKNNCSDLDERVSKAFRYYGSIQAKDDEALFEEYVRGGVDKIYEKLMDEVTNSEAYLKNLFDFIEEIDERYNQTITTDSIIDLCNLAKA